MYCKCDLYVLAVTLCSYSVVNCFIISPRLHELRSFATSQQAREVITLSRKDVVARTIFDAISSIMVAISAIRHKLVLLWRRSKEDVVLPGKLA